MRKSRKDRQYRNEIINDAASNMGMRRREFMRQCNQGDEDCKEELATSIAMHPDTPEEIDIDRLGEILQMLLNFFAALMKMWGGL